MGHSMGGHGALILGLKEKDIFTSVSAFSPIVHPTGCPWGQKAFKGYFGDDQKLALEHDATELIKSGVKRSDEILIHQGLADEFLEKELLSDDFVSACKEHGQQLTLNKEDGYDHSYYFISSFIEEHINFHLRALT